MIILLHSSKTMRPVHQAAAHLQRPQLFEKAKRLAQYLKTLSTTQTAHAMKLSSALAVKTHQLIEAWTDGPNHQSMVLDSFVGDIYSGLQVADFSSADRNYAEQTLRILSGLYGILRPLDGICPYRLEMSYKLPDPEFSSLPKYWGESIAATLPKQGLIVNLASAEYAQTVLPFVDPTRVVEPKFLTIDQETSEPTFVVIHAKIARGAFAHWLIKERIEDHIDAFSKFHDLGYHFDQKLSSPQMPTFVCESFGGKGLSIKKAS